MSSDNRIRIIVADDHRLFREGLIDLIKRDDQFDVIGEARNGKQAMDMALAMDVDVLVIDINMPELTGIEVAKNVLEQKSNVEFIALTIHNDPAYIKDAFSSGIKGYLLKDCSVEELHDAIRTVSDHQRYLSNEVRQIAVDQLVANEDMKEQLFELTERELEILKLILKEYSNAEIADELNISRRTVETHKRNLIEKTGSKNIVGLIIYAGKYGLF